MCRCRFHLSGLALITWYCRVFSVGSPHNIPAGHYANMDKLIAHYREKAYAEEEAKMRKLQESQQWLADGGKQAWKKVSISLRRRRFRHVYIQPLGPNSINQRSLFIPRSRLVYHTLLYSLLFLGHHSQAGKSTTDRCPCRVSEPQNISYSYASASCILQESVYGHVCYSYTPLLKHLCIVAQS